LFALFLLTNGLAALGLKDFIPSVPQTQHDLALQVARDKLVALGTNIGKFTHSGKFRLTIGALELLASYAKYKVLDPLQANSSAGIPP
jgi:ribosome biogenesis protein Nip4